MSVPATKFRKYVIEPGQEGREIARWDKWCGVDYAIRSSAVQRAKPPETGWTEDDELELSRFQEAIDRMKKQPMPTSEQGIEKYKERLKRNEDMLAQMAEGRAELTEWENLQIFRCIHGHQTLTGFHYFYFNFCKIEEISDDGKGTGRIISPNYRSCDDWAARFLLKAQEERRGTAVIKRRRFGWSWLLASFIMYNALLRDVATFFVTKDENDQRKFFDRMKWLHDRLPKFLQKPYESNALEKKSWGPSERIAAVRGIEIDQVPYATIRCASPKNIHTIAGGTCGLFIIDESGEIPNLEDCLSIGAPMLAAGNGLERAGCMILGGTVGKMSASGHAFKRIYKGPKYWELNQGFIPGWMGSFPDDLGNDDKSKAIAIITAKRQAAEEEGYVNSLIELKQQFPLDEKEAFQRNTYTKMLGDAAMQIDMARENIERNPPTIRAGLLYQNPKTKEIKLREQPIGPSGDDRYKSHHGHGQVLIAEMPRAELQLYENPYVIGVDPVDVNRDTYKESQSATGFNEYSDIAYCVWKRHSEVGGRGDIPVAYYCSRKADLNDDYDQLIYLSEMYFGASINVESQKAGRLEAYFMQKNKQHLLAYGTSQAMGIDKGSRLGFWNDGQLKWFTQVLGIAKQWWLHNYDCHTLIPRFIDEFDELKERNTDLAIAAMGAMQYSAELSVREQQGMNTMKDEKHEPITLWRNEGGAFVPIASPFGDGAADPIMGFLNEV